MKDFLTSGRFLAGVLGTGLLFLAGAPLLNEETAEALTRGVAFLGIFFFFAFTLTWQKKAFSELKKSDQLITNALQVLESRNKELESVIRESTVNGAKRAEKSVESAEKNIVVSLGRLGRTQKELGNQLEQHKNIIPMSVVEEVQKASEQRLRMESDPVGQKSAYNLSSIPPMKVVKSNTSGALGRSAAMIEVDGDSTEPFRRMQSMTAETWRPNVATIACSALNRIIVNSSNVVEIPPNQAEAYAERPLDFVVVDESVFTSGGWSGALQTFKLQTFIDLELFIKQSKRNGAVMIVVKSDRHYAMTNSLRDMADVLIHTDGVARAHDGSKINLDLCETIIAATSSEKESND